MTDMISTTLLPEPWTALGACLQVDPDAFFPVHGDTETANRARAICNGCDVVAECLAYALERREDIGVWGATTPLQRRRILKGRKP